MRLAVPAIAITIVMLALAGCGDQPQQGPGGQMPAPQVGVASPLSRDLPEVRELTGRIEAVEVVELKPRISGLIEKVLVIDGAEVKAGDPILEIDERPFHATVARAEAQVASAQSRLNQTKLQFERGKRLIEGNVIARAQFDDQEAAVHTAEAELAAAKAALESAKLDLGYTHVTAPIAGRIGKVLTTAGNLVQGGGPVPATLLATLVSVDPVNAVFDLDEAVWQRVAPRLRAAAGGGATLAADVALVGETGFPHHGQVTFVDNRIDLGSGAIRLRARLANPDRLLTPGAFARVRLEIAPPRPVLLVHERAILSRPDTRYVYTVDDKGVTGFRPVVVGVAIGQLRIIESGLQATDRIAVVGVAKIFYPGMPVAPTPASMETLEMVGAPAKGTPADAVPAPAGPEAAKPPAAAVTKPAEGAKP